LKLRVVEDEGEALHVAPEALGDEQDGPETVFQRVA